MLRSLRFKAVRGMKTRPENIIFYDTDYRRGRFYSQSFNWYDLR